MKVVLIVVLVLLFAAGVTFWLWEKHVPAPLAVIPSSIPAEPPTGPVPADASTNPAPTTNNSIAETTPNSEAATNAPATNGPSSSTDLGTVTNTPSTNAPPNKTSSQPVVVYEDKFTRDGELNNTEPDPKNINKNSWTVTSGDGVYAVKDGKVFAAGGAYDAVFLPVNGTSGVTLDGRQDFTLSATVTPDDTGHWMGLSLNKQPIIPGHNIFDAGRVELTVAAGYADAYDGGTALVHTTNAAGAGKPVTISIQYHSESGTITFSLAGKVISTLPITPDDIAALAVVAFGNGSSGPTAGLSDFTLTVGGFD